MEELAKEVIAGKINFLTWDVLKSGSNPVRVAGLLRLTLTWDVLK